MGGVGIPTVDIIMLVASWLLEGKGQMAMNTYPDKGGGGGGVPLHCEGKGLKSKGMGGGGGGGRRRMS